jgi:hypothetical protein
MYTNGNGAVITLNGCGIGGVTDDYLVDVNTGSAWAAVDFTFTTGTLGASQNFWFNSCGSIGGVAKNASDIRLDNFEIYEVSPYTAVNTPSGISKTNVYVKDNVIVADFDLAQASDIEISVFNAQGMLLNKTMGSFNSGKNTRIIDANLSSGLYLVRLMNEGKSITVKVIK